MEIRVTKVNADFSLEPPVLKKLKQNFQGRGVMRRPCLALVNVKGTNGMVYGNETTGFFSFDLDVCYHDEQLFLKTRDIPRQPIMSS